MKSGKKYINKIRELIEIEIMKIKKPNRNSGAEEYKEVKSATLVINNRMDQADERICETEDRNFEFIQRITKKKE